MNKWWIGKGTPTPIERSNGFHRVPRGLGIPPMFPTWWHVQHYWVSSYQPYFLKFKERALDKNAFLFMERFIVRMIWKQTPKLTNKHKFISAKAIMVVTFFVHDHWASINELVLPFSCIVFDGIPSNEAQWRNIGKNRQNVSL